MANTLPNPEGQSQNYTQQQQYIGGPSQGGQYQQGVPQGVPQNVPQPQGIPQSQGQPPQQAQPQNAGPPPHQPGPNEAELISFD